jgi:hypothetical protein
VSFAGTLGASPAGASASFAWAGRTPIDKTSAATRTAPPLRSLVEKIEITRAL